VSLRQIPGRGARGSRDDHLRFSTSATEQIESDTSHCYLTAAERAQADCSSPPMNPNRPRNRDRTAEEPHGEPVSAVGKEVADANPAIRLPPRRQFGRSEYRRCARTRDRGLAVVGRRARCAQACQHGRSEWRRETAYLPRQHLEPPVWTDVPGLSRPGRNSFGPYARMRMARCIGSDRRQSTESATHLSVAALARPIGGPGRAGCYAEVTSSSCPESWLSPAPPPARA
jgi:hypothetical protein